MMKTENKQTRVSEIIIDDFFSWLSEHIVSFEFVYLCITIYCLVAILSSK
jgi:hypothetical protein